MYEVIRFFTDLQDNNRAYSVGDIFPHTDCSYPVTEKRLAELASRNNLQKTPLIRYVSIEKVEEAPKKPVAKRAKKTAAK